MARKSARAKAQKRGRKRRPKGPFPFLKLTGELRNAVYRALLVDVTTPTKPFDVWDEELPRHDNMATYTALIRTCRTINEEASSILKEEHLPRTPFYFSSLRTFWTLANEFHATRLKDTGAMYILRAPIGREWGQGISATQAIVGHENTVNHLDLPYAVWTTLEKILAQSLGGVTEMTWSFDRGATIEARASGGRIFCAVQHPLRRHMPTHPSLKYFSRLTLAVEEGMTTATIEGEISDLLLAKSWHTPSDTAQLELSLKKWDAAVCHGRCIRWCFDSPALAADLRDMYEREGRAD